MSFAWPAALGFLLIVPALLAAYLLMMRRRRRRSITYSSLALLRTAIPARSRWLRYVPLAALLASLGVLAVASARPQLTKPVPAEKTSILLALDTSGSMCSTDVVPNRLAGAQKAALKFVNSQSSGVLIGLVEFNGYAELAVPPTTDRAELDHALRNLVTGPGTAIGAAILQSLDAIAQIDPQVPTIPEAVEDPSAVAPDTGGAGGAGTTTTTAPGSAPQPVTHDYVPDVIVLLTDGANNRGITPVDAAPYAAARRVRIYTIGYGTTQPGPLLCSPQQQGGFGGGGFGSGSFGGGGFPGGGPSPLVADLPPLQEVAQLTGGKSYTASDASELTKVFASLTKHIVVQTERVEVTDEFVVVGALLALAALAASFRWGAYP
jgi:Ca-activated chloride channel homolog